VRLKMPKITPPYFDLVYGTVGKDVRKDIPTNPTEFYEDPILLKSDGLPTYHLANVVDDHYMGITHVIRATVIENCISAFTVLC
jgi:glutamyl-tRNA synthetase